MRSIIIFLTVLLYISFTSCNNCEFECFSPVEPTRHILIDSITQENLITNGTFDASNFSIISVRNENLVLRIEENALIFLGLMEGPQVVEVKHLDDKLFEIHFDLERVNEDCCSFVIFNDRTVIGADSFFDSSQGTRLITRSFTNMRICVIIVNIGTCQL